MVCYKVKGEGDNKRGGKVSLFLFATYLCHKMATFLNPCLDGSVIFRGIWHHDLFIVFVEGNEWTTFLYLLFPFSHLKCRHANQHAFLNSVFLKGDKATCCYFWQYSLSCHIVPFAVLFQYLHYNDLEVGVRSIYMQW